MSNPSIPVEVRQVAEAALVDFLIGRAGDRHGLDVMLEAVAPLISRAAAIEELKRLEHALMATIAETDESGYEQVTLDADGLVEVIQERIAELEEQ